MAIKVNDLFFTYMKKTNQSTHALKGINLCFEDNSFTAIIGHTGSGKSTLVQMLNGLLFPDSGTVEINNYLLTPNKRKNKNLKDIRKHVGMVFQFPEYQLFEETVIKDVAFGAKNFGYKENEAMEIAKKALEKVGIPESYYERSPFELSGGEKRRVAIAGILAIDPEVIVMDEPTAGLDPKGSKDIMDLLKEMHESGKTIILITHNMEHVIEYAKKVVVLDNGVITYEGCPKKLFESNINTGMIEVPMIYKFIEYCKSHNVDLDYLNISDIDSLAKEIAKWRKKNG